MSLTLTHSPRAFGPDDAPSIAGPNGPEIHPEWIQERFNERNGGLSGRCDGFDALLDSRRSLRNKLLLDGREKLGYGELIDRVDRFPAWLKAQGVPQGARIVVASRSASVIATFFIAALRLDFTLVVLDPDASERERDIVGRFVEPTLIVADDAVPCRPERPSSGLQTPSRAGRRS